MEKSLPDRGRGGKEMKRIGWRKWSRKEGEEQEELEEEKEGGIGRKKRRRRETYSVHDNVGDRDVSGG